jgi:hypothetical protein
MESQKYDNIDNSREDRDDRDEYGSEEDDLERFDVDEVDGGYTSDPDTRAGRRDVKFEG